MTRLPDFVVLGQGKAGTSLIYNRLSEIPEIGLSTPKELHYFNANFDRSLNWYADHFDDDKPNIRRVGEVSPSYLLKDAITRIAGTLGRNTKIIFVLRNPIEQAYSRYLQNICATREGQSFHIISRNIGQRLERIYQSLKRCYEVFGEDNILQLSFEHDIAAPGEPYLQKILQHIDLGDVQIPTKTDTLVNPGTMPRWIHTQDEHVIISVDRQTYFIPSDSLVFCAQKRNSKLIRFPSHEDVAIAFFQQSRWSTEVSKREYQTLQSRFILENAERFSKTFGFDLRHWNGPAKKLKYTAGAPPPRLKSRQNGWFPQEISS